MAENRIITQLCIVVHDVKKVNANWAKILGVPEEKIETIFPEGIHHYTYGKATDYKATEYKDCQVAKYQLENFVLELLQPGQSSSPWRSFLEKNGQGVFHVCIFVDDRKVFQQKLSGIGLGLPYHIGYYGGGSYSYVDSKEQLGLELSVNHQGDYAELIQKLLEGVTKPFDELR
jgi:methylmalonyl-CoA/ethylmalonyl-CoA epimerase